MKKQNSKKYETYYAVFTLSGNFALVDNLLDSHDLELEIYAENKEHAREQFTEHKNSLKKAGFLA